MLASYVIAMTVIPLFCARFSKPFPHMESITRQRPLSFPGRPLQPCVQQGFNHVLDVYERAVRGALKRPGLTVAAVGLLFVASLGIYPFVGRAFFPQTDAGSSP